MIRHVFCVLIACSLLAPPIASEQLLTLNWEDLSQESPLAQLVSNGSASITGDGNLVVDCPADGCEWTLAEIVSPPIQGPVYGLTGRIQYEGVHGEGMLELLNDFSSGQYFTRTVGDSGPLGKLSGDSDWRDVALPFDTFGKELPSKLTLRLVLPGEGRVSLSALDLVEGDSMQALFVSSGGSVAPRVIGWVVVALAGLTIGILSGMGKARRLVLGLAWGVLAIGVMAIGLGVYARFAELYGSGNWISSGLMCVIMAVLLVPVLRRRYAELELRKIRAMDA